MIMIVFNVSSEVSWQLFLFLLAASAPGRMISHYA